jgi:hypothetical protein
MVIEGEVHGLDRRKGPVGEGDPADRFRVKLSQALGTGQNLQAGRVQVHNTSVIWCRFTGR